jgi:hypothetical protein
MERHPVTDQPATIEMNDGTFVVSAELAASLASTGIIDLCRECDPDGHTYHLDIDHTEAELLAAGAEPMTSPTNVNKVSLIRRPIFLAHHESGGR